VGSDPLTKLRITADDWGYSPHYDRGIEEALAAGVLDAIGVMVLRDPDPAPLLASGIAVGLHLELGEHARVDKGGCGVGRSEVGIAVTELIRQLEEFERIFGRPAAYIDGHGHCHAGPSVAEAIARQAKRLGLPIRSVSAEHRAVVRAAGAETNDVFIGRHEPGEPRVPPEIEAYLAGDDGALRGHVEWMVHPGHPDPENPRPFDPVRVDDLAVLLEIANHPRLQAIRGPHPPPRENER
jgi:predicted glycoside hydrolase/deacetylase ChbG (UPF0249 family)